MASQWLRNGRIRRPGAAASLPPVVGQRFRNDRNGYGQRAQLRKACVLAIQGPTDG